VPKRDKYRQYWALGQMKLSLTFEESELYSSDGFKAQGAGDIANDKHI
jgi:hypothetical protein